jgi:hypothetical protein
MTGKQTDRAERLAAALRENLRKRKAQNRAPVDEMRGGTKADQSENR